jgi:hypothetical protein
MSDTPILTARVDGEDRLVEADAAFAALNARAGGAPGRVLAVPQLATVVRLARRLRILVSRGVTIADGEADVDCWVKATPDEAGVTLAVSLLRERPAWRAPLIDGAATPPPPPGADWTWEADAELRLTRVAAEAGARHGFDVAGALAQPLTRLFALGPDADGAMPLLDAMAERTDFDRQPATVRASGVPVTLAGSVRVDGAGAFAGFVGGVYTASAPAPAVPAPAADALFNARLEPILRGPLGRIVAAADSINAAAEGPIDPHYGDYAADIASAARHLLGLVDDLRDLEAIERPDFTIEAETIDLADVARRAAGLLAVRAADAGVTIDRSDTDTPLPARGEFRRALQIMVNLIGNAVRYSPQGATVWLRLQRDGAQAVAIVADQGKGIAADDQARIFDKFERLDPSEAGGSGLGLYIARRLARAMGGELTVDSAPGAGARFVLTLPAA